MLSFLGRGGGAEKAETGPSSMDAEPSTSDLSDASSVSISLEATLEGHTDRAWCVAWEPQGRFLATCSSDQTARLWAPSSAAGGAWVTVAELEGVHNRTVRSITWSPCGTSIRKHIKTLETSNLRTQLPRERLRRKPPRKENHDFYKKKKNFFSPRDAVA